MSEDLDYQPNVSRSAAWALAGTTIGLVANLGEAVLVVNVLGESRFGVFTLLVVATGFAVMFADLGLKSATVAVGREQNGDAEFERVLRTASAIRTMTVVSLTTAIVFGLLVLDQARHTWWLPAMFAAASLDEMGIATLRADERHRVVAQLTAGRALFRLAVSALLLAAGWRVGAPAAAWVFGFGLTALIALGSRRRRPGFPLDRGASRALLKFGRRTAATRLLRTSAMLGPTAMLGFVGPTVEVGRLGAVQRLTSGLQTGVDTIANVVYPRLAALAGSGRPTQATSLLKSSATALSALLTVGVIGSLAVGHLTLEFALDLDPQRGRLILMLLVGALQFGTPAMLVGFWRTANGDPGVGIRFAAIEVVLLGILSPILGASFGGIGIAVATAVGAIATLPFAFRAATSAGADLPARDVLALVATTIAATAVALFEPPFVPGTVVAVGLAAFPLSLLASAAKTARRIAQDPAEPHR